MPESLFSDFRDYFQHVSVVQALIWTWSGLQWSKVRDVHHPQYLSQAVCVHCVRLVMQFMVRDCTNEPVSFPALVVPSAFPSPY